MADRLPTVDEWDKLDPYDPYNALLAINHFGSVIPTAGDIIELWKTVNDNPYF